MRKYHNYTDAPIEIGHLVHTRVDTLRLFSPVQRGHGQQVSIPRISVLFLHATISSTVSPPENGRSRKLDETESFCGEVDTVMIRLWGRRSVTGSSYS